MMTNRIPRKFNRIVVKMKIETSESKVGDIFHVYKNDCGTGYLGLNKRTGKYCYIFPSMFRNSELVEIQDIEN